MAATPKINFWPRFPIHSFRQFSAKTYRFATIQNVTDIRQTDRWHSVPKVWPIVRSAKNRLFVFVDVSLGSHHFIVWCGRMWRVGFTRVQWRQMAGSGDCWHLSKNHLIFQVLKCPSKNTDSDDFVLCLNGLSECIFFPGQTTWRFNDAPFLSTEVESLAFKSKCIQWRSLNPKHPISKRLSPSSVIS